MDTRIKIDELQAFDAALTSTAVRPLLLLRQPLSAGQRSRAKKRRGSVGAKAEDALAGRQRALVMCPVAFMQRWAALVPQPWLHLIRLGVRVTSLREMSGPPPAPLRQPRGAGPEHQAAGTGGAAGPNVGEQATEAVAAAEREIKPAQPRPARIRWARLLKRVSAPPIRLEPG